MNCIKLRFRPTKCIFSVSFSPFSTTCGSNGIFSRRLDFSLYNVLPKQRINSIEVKVIMEISFYNCAKKSLKLQIIAIMQKKFAMKSFTRSNLTRAFNQMEKEFEDKPKRKFMKKFWTLLSGMVFEIFLEFWITFEILVYTSTWSLKFKFFVNL